MAEGYEEDGGATIDTLAGLYRCVRELLDERDRLRAGLDAGRAQWVKEARHAARRIGEGARERDRLRAVVRKLVAAAGLAIEGTEGEWISYAYEEYAERHEFTTDEQAAYQRALDASAEATDG